jgi:HK97 gp10 family phage protein
MVSAAVESVNNFALFARSLNDGIEEGLEAAGKLIVNLASQLAPEDTGKLKESGDYTVEGKVLEVSFGNGLSDDRAIAQEYGTMFMPAQPYLSVAVREIDITGEIAQAVMRRLL